jgi:hypothetical protein
MKSTIKRTNQKTLSAPGGERADAKRGVRCHLCAIPRCGEAIKPSLLMCPAHWRMVPWDVQVDVLAKFRRYNKAKELRTKLDAGNVLRAAHREAIKAALSAQAEMRGAE